MVKLKRNCAAGFCLFVFAMAGEQMDEDSWAHDKFEDDGKPNKVGNPKRSGGGGTTFQVSSAVCLTDFNEPSAT
jgi:hypothetical protein